ncbi:hypothetical protein Goarm_003189, partial [Gossypium armourianum]|nr:hypothetical protein [Gossypium armourianum]
FCGCSLIPICFQLSKGESCFHNFKATIGKEIVDVTLIARRCTRRNG